MAEETNSPVRRSRSAFWNFDVGTLITLVSLLAFGFYWKADVDNRVATLSKARDEQASDISKLSERLMLLDRDGTASGNNKMSALSNQMTAFGNQLTSVLAAVDRKYDTLDSRIRPVETAVIQLSSIPQDMRDVKLKLEKIVEQQATLSARMGGAGPPR